MVAFAGSLTRRPCSIHIALLVALCALLYLPPLHLIPFYNKGEPREALEVQYIVTEGEWLFPLKGEGAIPSKPPLFHWTGALLSLAWGDTNEATVRFPSALYAIAGAILTYLLGCRLFDCKIGFLAAVILATTFVYEKQAVEARVDMTLTFFVTASLVVFYFIYQGWLRGSWGFYGFYFLLGVGVLAKGPVGVILPVMTAAIFLALRGRWNFLSRLFFHKGVFLGLGIGFFWYAAALLQGGEEFFGRQILKENLSRFFVYGEGGTGHQKPIYYYAPYLFLQGLPWSLVLPFMIVHWIRHKALAEEGALFLIVWITVVFCFFSLAAGKRAVYLLPLYPALALLTARWFESKREFAVLEKIGFRTMGAFCFVVAVALAMLFLLSLQSSSLALVFSRFGSASREGELQLLLDTILRHRVWLFAVLLGATSLWFLAGWRFFNLEARRIPALLFFISTLVWFPGQMIVVPAMAEARSYRDFVHEVKRIAADSEVYLYGGEFDSVPVLFYYGVSLPLLEEEPKTLVKRLRVGGDYVIMSEKEWQHLYLLDPSLPRPVLRSEGTGPDGDTPLVLLQGTKSAGGNP